MTEQILIDVLSCDSLAFTGPYSTAFEGAKSVIAASGGKIVRESPAEGFVETRYKYGINFFGLRVRWEFRQTPSGTIAIQTHGYFSDAMDTSGKAQKKAADQLAQFVELAKTNYGAKIRHESHLFPEKPPPIVSEPTDRSASPAENPPTLHVIDKQLVASGIVGKSQRTLAIWSMVIGIASLLVLGLIGGLPAVILGGIARANMHRTNNFNGKGMATAGSSWELQPPPLAVWSDG
jgi:hypothetical protein